MHYKTRHLKTDQAVTLKKLKAKIIKLNSKQEQDRIIGEEPSLHHLLKTRKRQVLRTVHQMYDTDGSQKTSPADILRLFTEHMRPKYDRIQTNKERMRHMMNCGLKTIPLAANIALKEPITMEELFQAIKLGKPNKAPGHDGICLEFIKKTWEVIKYDLLEIMNDMYRDGIISDQQNHGILVCLPKKLDPMRIEDYRPLTLMNTDYKLFTRIIANRLQLWLVDILYSSQHCGLSGNTAFDAVATI